VSLLVLPLHECADPAAAKSATAESPVEPLHSVANSTTAESVVEPLQSVADSVTNYAASGAALTKTY
jgi:hypothetical protein